MDELFFEIFIYITSKQISKSITNIRMNKLIISINLNKEIFK